MEPTTRTYNRIIQMVCEQPWAILPSTLATMRDLLAMRAAGFKFTAEEIAERIGVPEARGGGPSTPSQGGIAVLPVWGVIGHRANELRDISSSIGTSTEILGAQIAQLVDDPNVTAIVLDINSPGGGVFGVQEVADSIRSARGKKPIVAVANALSASAAYWIGSAATEFIVTPSGLVGAIGVFSIHEDHSKELAEKGVNVTLTRAGKYKAENNPFGPLSDDAKQAVQERVDAFYGQFTRAVAKGRGVALDAVQNGFGEGRVVDAKVAVKLGMADRVATMDEVIADLVAGRVPAGAKAALEDDLEPISDGNGLQLAAKEPIVDEIQPEGVPDLAAVAAARSSQSPEMTQRRLRLRLLELGG